MSLSKHPFRGPFFMVVATGSYVINDSFMKLATVGLPPYEVLMLRGAFAALWGFPLLFVLGFGRQLPQMFERFTLFRNFCELGASSATSSRSPICPSPTPRRWGRSRR